MIGLGALSPGEYAERANRFGTFKVELLKPVTG